MSGEAPLWTRTDGPDGAVRFDVAAPRRPLLAFWAVGSAVAFTVAAAGLAALLATAVFPGLAGAQGPGGGWVLVVAVFVLMIGSAIPGAWRLARWRTRGRESVVVADGRAVLSRTGRGEVALDVSAGAAVRVVGDVDTWYVRATRWRSGRVLRTDDVPGFDVGSVAIVTRDAEAMTGLSLRPDDARALTEALCALPNFGPDRSPAEPGRPRGG